MKATEATEESTPTTTAEETLTEEPEVTETEFPTEEATETDEEPTETTEGETPGGTTLPADAVWVVIDERIVPAVEGASEIQIGNTRGLPVEMRLDVAPDGSLIAFAGALNYAAGVLNTQTGEVQGFELPLGERPSGIELAPDGNRTAYTNPGAIPPEQGDQFWQLAIIDVATGEQSIVIQEQRQGDYVLTPIEWTEAGIYAEGQSYGTHGGTERLVLIDPQTGNFQPLVDEFFIHLQLSDDQTMAAQVTGTLATVGSSELGLTIIDLQTGGKTEVEPVAQAEVLNTAWSPDSAQLAYLKQADDETLHIVNSDGSDLRSLALDTFSGRALDIDWLDAETLLVLANADGTLMLYQLALDNLTVAGLQQVAALGTAPGPDRANPEIIYVPR